jgi:hypothetical protein
LTKISLTAKLRELLVSPVARDGRDEPGRSEYERLAIPHTFKPQLSLGEAAIAAAGAFLRILFGSLLFAVWGTYTFLAWNMVRNVLLRGLVLLVLLVLFAAMFVLLMLGIAALVRMFWPQSHPPIPPTS